MASWWFDQASVEEAADVLACSYLERARQAPAADLRLVDRGMPMREASVAGDHSGPRRHPPEAAAERTRALLAAYQPDLG